MAKTETEQPWDIDAITTRMIAENFGAADVQAKQRELYPDMHLFLASRTGPDKSGLAGGQVTYQKSIGFRVLSEDPLITGSPDWVLMGVPQAAKDEFRRRKVEENNRGLQQGDAPVGMKQLVEMGSPISAEKAAQEAAKNLDSGWDGSVSVKD